MPGGGGFERRPADAAARGRGRAFPHNDFSRSRTGPRAILRRPNGVPSITLQCSGPMAPRARRTEFVPPSIACRTVQIMATEPVRSPNTSASTLPFSLSAALEAGLMAGLAFLLLEYLSALLLGAPSAMGPAYVTLHSYINLDPSGRTEPYTLTVLFVHFALSLGTTLLLAYVIRHVVRMWAVTLGVVYGLILYGINFFLFAMWLPDITAASDLFMVGNYMIYGGVAAWAYTWRRADRPAA